MSEASGGTPAQGCQGKGSPGPEPQQAALGHSWPHLAPDCSAELPAAKPGVSQPVLRGKELQALDPLPTAEGPSRAGQQLSPWRGSRRPAGGRSPKSMRSLWFLCSRARSSCLRGAEVSRGMLGRDTGRSQPGRVLREGPRPGLGHLHGH